MFRFPFMFDQLAKPLTIKVPSDDNAVNAAGFPIKRPTTEVHVREPLVVNTNPSITFDTGPGGVISSQSLVWQSKRFRNAPRGTEVIDGDGNRYRVSGKAKSNLSDSTIYQVKAVGNK